MLRRECRGWTQVFVPAFSAPLRRSGLTGPGPVALLLADRRVRVLWVSRSITPSLLVTPELRPVSTADPVGSRPRRHAGCRGAAMVLVLGFWTFLRAVFFGSAAVALENLALRHQLLVLQRSVDRPRLARWDRVFWVWLSRVWVSWRSSLVIVQPATVLAWHRRGFQLYWRWKSRPNPVGRPRLDPELRRLIRRMARENPTWGRRRIRAELALLGYEVAELTVAKYMHRTSPRPSPTWRAFLAAHAPRHRRCRLLPRPHPDLPSPLRLRRPSA